ncbi:MAG: hypothetical protein ABUL62_27970 [Myxococcales bacterium]
MSNRINRRAALKPIAAMSVAALVPAALLACSKNADCNDVSALSPDELRTRNEIAKYVDQSLEAAKRCSGCVQYIPAAPKQCGGCKVVKGPINPNGGCILFVLKQT